MLKGVVGQLAVPVAVQRAKLRVIVTVIHPAAVVQHLRGDHDTRCLAAQVHVTVICRVNETPGFLRCGLHEATAGRQQREVPHAAVVVRQETIGVQVHVVFGAHEIVAEQRRQETQARIAVRDARGLKSRGVCIHQKSSQSGWLTVPDCAVTE